MVCLPGKSLSFISRDTKETCLKSLENHKADRQEGQPHNPSRLYPYFQFLRSNYNQSMSPGDKCVLGQGRIEKGLWLYSPNKLVLLGAQQKAITTLQESFYYRKKCYMGNDHSNLYSVRASGNHLTGVQNLPILRLKQPYQAQTISFTV